MAILSRSGGGISIKCIFFLIVFCVLLSALKYALSPTPHPLLKYLTSHIRIPGNSAEEREGEGEGEGEGDKPFWKLNSPFRLLGGDKDNGARGFKAKNALFGGGRSNRGNRDNKGNKGNKDKDGGRGRGFNAMQWWNPNPNPNTNRNNSGHKQDKSEVASFFEKESSYHMSGSGYSGYSNSGSSGNSDYSGKSSGGNTTSSSSSINSKSIKNSAGKSNKGKGKGADSACGASGTSSNGIFSWKDELAELDVQYML